MNGAGPINLNTEIGFSVVMGLGGALLGRMVGALIVLLGVVVGW